MELDAAEGCVDEEAHKQLEVLRKQMARLESGPANTLRQQNSQRPTDVEIAHELDKYAPFGLVFLWFAEGQILV